MIQVRILSWKIMRNHDTNDICLVAAYQSPDFSRLQVSKPFQSLPKILSSTKKETVCHHCTHKIELRIYLHMILSLILYKNLPKFWDEKKSPNPNPTWNSKNHPKKLTSRAEQHSSTGSKAFIALPIFWEMERKANSPKLTWNCSKIPILPFQLPMLVFN